MTYLLFDCETLDKRKNQYMMKFIVSEENKKTARHRKYYAIIVMEKTHFVALGRLENFNVAQEVANAFLVRNASETLIPQLLSILDEWEMRAFLGEVIKPIYVGPTRKKGKREVEVQSEDEEGGEQEALPTQVQRAPVVNTTEPVQAEQEIIGHRGGVA